MCSFCYLALRKGVRQTSLRTYRISSSVLQIQRFVVLSITSCGLDLRVSWAAHLLHVNKEAMISSDSRDCWGSLTKCWIHLLVATLKKQICLCQQLSESHIINQPHISCLLLVMLKHPVITGFSSSLCWSKPGALTHLKHSNLHHHMPQEFQHTEPTS